MASIFCSPVYQSPSSLLNSSLRSFVRCKSQYFQGCIQNRPFSVHASLYKPHRLPTPKGPTIRETIRENIYTIPNALTVSRILACPVLGWSILNSNFKLATGLLVYAGLTDLVCPPRRSVRILSRTDIFRLMDIWRVVSKCIRSWEQSLTLRRTRR